MGQYLFPDPPGCKAFGCFWEVGRMVHLKYKAQISKMLAIKDGQTLVCQYNVIKKNKYKYIYLRTKHGTISPFSILLSHDEHTPWWIGPAPSEKDDHQPCTLHVSLHSHSLSAQKSGPSLNFQSKGHSSHSLTQGKLL